MAGSSSQARMEDSMKNGHCLVEGRVLETPIPTYLLQYGLSSQQLKRPYFAKFNRLEDHTQDPHESIILQSAVCSQSNQSTTSTRKSVSQRPPWPEDPISPSQNDTISRKDLYCLWISAIALLLYILDHVTSVM